MAWGVCKRGSAMRRVVGGGGWGRVEVYVFVSAVVGATADSDIGVVVTMWSPPVGLLEAAGRV